MSSGSSWRSLNQERIGPIACGIARGDITERGSARMDRDVGIAAGQRAADIGGSRAVVFYQRNKIDRFSRINESVVVPSRIIDPIVIVKDYRYR
jgi:hypothetical protein